MCRYVANGVKHSWKGVREFIGAVSISRQSYHIEIIIIKIRWSHDCLILIRGIPYLGRWSLYWKGLCFLLLISHIEAWAVTFAYTSAVYQMGLHIAFSMLLSSLTLHLSLWYYKTNQLVTDVTNGMQTMFQFLLLCCHNIIIEARDIRNECNEIPHIIILKSRIWPHLWKEW